MTPRWLAPINPLTPEERRRAQKREFYARNIHEERAKARQRARKDTATLCEEEDRERMRKERRRETDARYRAEHRDLLRMKARQYRHAKKRCKQIAADEVEYQRLMSMDFDTLVMTPDVDGNM